MRVPSRTISIMLVTLAVAALIAVGLAWTRSETPNNDDHSAGLPPTNASTNPTATSTPAELASDPTARVASSPTNRAATRTPVAETQTPASVPPSATPVTPSVELRRLIMPSIGVNAEVEARGVSTSGVMETPTAPQLVAWYGFSAKPTESGNIVMSGHVDYYRYGPAVFWKLEDLRVDDRIEIEVADGRRFAYRVVSIDTVAADTPPEAIVNSNGVEQVTLITCTGGFERSSLSYDRRLIVRAEPIPA